MTYINDTISNCILWGHKDEEIIFILHLLRTWQSKSITKVKNVIDVRNTSKRLLTSLDLYYRKGPIHHKVEKQKQVPILSS